MIIENTQKTTLLDEAAQEGITKFQLYSIPEVYTKMLGDIEGKSFGLPLAPVYVPKRGEKIDVPKIAKFVKGLNRDIKVGDESVSDVAKSIASADYEYSVKLSLLKNRVNRITNTANLQGYQNATSATWTFGDSFADTSKIDMLNSSVWVDTSEGSVTIPSNGPSSSVNPQEISVTSFTSIAGADNLGTNPIMAVDGLDSTSWKALFSTTDTLSAVFSFAAPKNLTSIQVDPTGYGMWLTIEADDGSGFKQIINEIVYKKTTLSFSAKNTLRVRVNFGATGASLPKSVGIKNLLFFSGNLASSASLITQTITIPVSYSNMVVDYVADIPSGASINISYSTNGVLWQGLDKGSWLSVSENPDVVINLDTSAITQDGGFYSVTAPNAPLSLTTGSLAVGLDQVEVSAFKFDYTAIGDNNHIPSSDDFLRPGIRVLKTWSDIPTVNERSYDTHLFVNNGLSQTTNIVSGANILPFQFKPSGDSYAAFSILALQGGSQSTCQPNYTYKCGFYVFCAQGIYISDAKAFFLQGFRDRGFRSFSDSGRLYGAYGFYVNNTLVSASSKPYTVYTSADSGGSYIEGGINGLGENGVGFNFTLKAGWNLVELLIQVEDPAVYGEDNGSGGLDPYLQLSLSPSFFDPKFKEYAGITKVVASGEVPPLDEFELLWNTPQDQRYWAWSSFDSKVLFNTYGVPLIDGFFKGTNPNYELVYPRTPDNDPSISSINLRFDLIDDPVSGCGPIIRSYTGAVK